MSKLMWCPTCQKRVLAMVGGVVRYTPGGDTAAATLPVVDTTYSCGRCGRELETLFGLVPEDCHKGGKAWP